MIREADSASVRRSLVVCVDRICLFCMLSLCCQGKGVQTQPDVFAYAAVCLSTGHAFVICLIWRPRQDNSIGSGDVSHASLLHIRTEV